VKKLTVGGSAALLVASGLMTAAAVSAQAAPTAERKADAASLATASAAQLIADHAPALHVGSGDAFSAPKVTSVPEGLQYVAYERTYRGLPVVGGDFVVVTDAAGKVLSTSVAQTQTLSLDNLQPAVGKARAVLVSKGALKGAEGVSGSHLVVVADGAGRLAWESVATKGEMHKLHVFVDARSGKVLSSYDEVVRGEGTGHYNGPSPLHIDTSTGRRGFTMVDPVRSKIQCGSSRKAFTSTDDVWGNGVGSDLETACVDSLYDVAQEWSMLSDWLGRNGITGTGTGFPIQVGLNAVNAYYDGTKVAIGHNQAGDWISSMDVVAHEFGHGIDDHTPGGISGGGTQEFIADTFGATTEFYDNQSSPYDTPDYLVGEEIDLVGQGPIRNMYDPSQAGDPNCYSSSIPSTEVHAAAGPGNHWFFLAAEGSAGTTGQPQSPTCNGQTVTGIGIAKVSKILYNAMLQKTSASSYLNYRLWTLNAAKTLYPGSCTEFNAIKAAWDAVSVPAQSGEPTCA